MYKLFNSLPNECNFNSFDWGNIKSSHICVCLIELLYPSRLISSHLTLAYNVDPPSIRQCHITTTSLPDPPNAPCTCPTREAGEGVTTVSSQRRWPLPTGLAASTSIFTSRTGSQQRQQISPAPFGLDPELFEKKQTTLADSISYCFLFDKHLST